MMFRNSPARWGLPTAFALGMAVAAPAALADDGEMVQTQSDDTAQVQESQPQRSVIVTNVRPLRTFRGEAVNVYTNNQSEQSIGIVRPLRTSPLNDYRTNYSRINRFDRSDRWVQREIALGRIDPNDKSIGIVRQYRYPVAVERPSPGVLIFRNPNPVSPDSFATSSPAAGDAETYEVRTVEDLEASAQSDPWALLNEGFYRDALKLFGAGAKDDVATQTGVALATALSGDLAGATELMPDTPSLPKGVELSKATQQRIDQFTQFFYEDDAAMRDALRSLLPAESGAKAG